MSWVHARTHTRAKHYTRAKFSQGDNKMRNKSYKLKNKYRYNYCNNFAYSIHMLHQIRYMQLVILLWVIFEH